jgi:hypothetical protein
MKKLLLTICLIFPSLCWGWLSPENEVIYKQAWDLFNMKEIQQGIDLCSKVIDDESVSDLDRFHFLISRSMFLVDYYERKKDLDRIKEMTMKNEECAWEFSVYYK